MKAARQAGASLVELLVGLPMFVLLIFIIAELALLHEAKSMLDVASLAAAAGRGAGTTGTTETTETTETTGPSPAMARATAPARRANDGTLPPARAGAVWLTQILRDMTDAPPIPRG